MKPNDPRLYWYLEKLEELRLKPEAKIIGLSKGEFLEYIDILFGPILDEKGKTVFIEDFRYVSYAVEKLLKIKLKEYLEAKGNIPQEIIQAADDFGDVKKAEEARSVAKDKVDQFITKQEQLKTTNLAQAEENLTQEIETIVRETSPQLVEDKPELVKVLTKEIEEELLLNFFEAPKQTLKKETYETIIDRISVRVDQTLEERNIPLTPEQTASLKRSLRAKLPAKTLAEASTLTSLDFKLSRQVREKLPVQGTAFSSIASLLHPIDSARRFTGLPVKAAQVVIASELSDEESIRQQLETELKSSRRDTQKIARLAQMLQEIKEFKLTNRELTYSSYGLTSQDFQKSIDFLRKELGAGHPIVRFLEIQKGRQESFELKFPNARKKIESAFALKRRLGQRPAVIELRGNYTSLPTSESVGSMSQAFNQIGTATRFYQSVIEYPGIKVIRSLPLQKFADLRSFIYRKTLHPVFARLGKTALGKAIKTTALTAFKETTKKALIGGLKKAGVWLITKLGLKGITTTIGTALGGPLGAAIGFLAGFVIEPILKLGKNLLSKFKQLITKPEYLAAMGIGGAVLIFGVGGAIGFSVGVPLLLLFGFGMAAGGSAFLGGWAAGMAAIFTAFFAPFAVPIAAFIISLMIALMVITFFIVILVASAFIIPASPTELAEKASVYLRVTKTASQYEIPNDELQNNPSVSYTIRITAAQPIDITQIRDQRTITCDPANTNNPQVETPVDIPLPPGSIRTWRWPDDDSHSLTFDDSFEDCRVCNTVTVIGNVVDGPTGEESSHTACVNIGNPPEDCPSGWPTARGRITQGPSATFSHHTQEAVDIGFPALHGDEVWATHTGEVTFADPTNFGGNVVKIKGTCNGVTFYSLYEHLDTINRNMVLGNEVSFGQVVGTLGKTGTKDDHLHYQFNGLEMASPYIPINNDILRGCISDCNTQW